MSNPRTRKTDRFLAILLTFMMVIGMLPVSVYAGPTEFPDKFTVTVKDENDTPVYGAAVTYTLKVDGEEKLSDQSTESTNSDGIAAIDLSVYEENITAGTVTISVTVSKDPFFEDATVQDEAVTDATGNIDITLLSRTVTVTGTVNDHENNPVDGAAVEFSGAEMVNPVTYTGADGSFTLNYVPVCENGKLTITAPESVSDKYDSFTYNIPFSAAETVSCGILAFELKTYKVTFVSNAFGRFTTTESDDAITELTVKHGDDVSFRFVPSDGYDATITDGETPLVAQEDIYTITDVREAHTVTAATTDIQAPVIEEISVQDESTWAQEKNIDVVVKDNAGIEQVRIYISLTEYADYEQLAAGGEAAASLPYKVSANGIYYVYAVDAANNFAKDSVEVKTVDIDAPAVDGFTPIPQGPSKTPRYEFTVTDTQSGIASVQFYKFGKEDDKQDADADGPEGKYYFIADENTEYFVVVTDNAGNTQTYSTTVENYDGDAPSITGVNASAKWSDSDNTVSFTANDTFAIAELYYSTTLYDSLDELRAASDVIKIEVNAENGGNGTYSFTVTENGTYYIYAVDDADNMAFGSVVVAYIDKTAPTVDTIEKDPDAEWHNGTVTISGTVSDIQGTGNTAGSGVVSVVYSIYENGYADGSYSTADYTDGNYSFTVSAEEFNGTYYVWAIDEVGHVTGNPNSIAVKIDKTAPSDVSMKYVEDTNKGWIERVINVLTFGLVFKDEIYIDVHAEDNRAGQDSGIWKYQYQLVEDGQELNDDNWNDVVSSNEDEEIKLNVEETENFLGKVYIRVWDVAGNCSTAYTHTENGDEMVIVKDNGTPNVPILNLNGYTEDVWTNNDVVINISGSVSVSGIKEYQYRIDYADENIPNVNWTVMPESTGTQIDLANGEAYIQDKITISADTNATYYFRAITNSDDPADPDKPSDEVSVVVKVQKSIPQNATETIAEANGTNDWYVENYPQITITEPAVDENSSPVTTYYKLWDTNKGESEDSVGAVAFNGSNAPVISSDGMYILKIWTVDEAGNKCADADEIIDEINVDLTAPKDLTIKIDDESVAAGNSIAFDTFYKDSVTVMLDADCDISGLKSLQYQKVHAVSDYNEDGEWLNYPSEGIVVDPSEKFVIYFRAEDMAGNVTIISSTGIVVDDKLPEGEVNAPEIDILPETPNANGFYNGDVDVNLAVTDPKYNGQTESENGDYSGLNKITYRIYTTDTDAVEEGTLLDITNGVTTGAVYDADGLISSWSGGITVSGNTFNSNHVYVELTAVDNAGNARTTTTSAGEIRIDITAPTIDISYDNNSADNDSYFHDNRTATIVVTERNFDPEDVRVTITNTDGVIPTISTWERSEGTGNQDDTTWTATVTFSADGDYTFDISYTDLADNICEGVNYGSSVSPTEFTVDKTLPTVSVSYDNNAASNGTYFSASRMATVVITEHNFDVNRVVFTQTAALDGTDIAIPSPSWSSSGDVHTAVIVFTADGDYTFEVAVTDMAANESNPADYGSSVASNAFTVDRTIEKPVIGGIVNGGAYKNDVIPTISFSDVNYDSYEIRLLRTRLGEKDEDVTDLFITSVTEQEHGGSGTYDTFEKIVENDGIYTLTVTMKDKAGNQETEEYTFTVNRFGSVYEYSDYLVSLIKDGGQYITISDGNNSAITEDLVITEYNANRLLEGSLKILITRDGEAVDAVYTTNPENINNQVGIGESGWYQYEYTISASNFKEDGVYRITLSSQYAASDSENNDSASVPDNSVDAEGNRILDTMNFTVDTKAPEIRNIVNLEEAIINAQTVDVKYTIVDVGGLKSIEVILNGETIQTITEFGDNGFNYSGQFTINESNSAQTVQLKVTDLAGNVTDTAADDFSTGDLYIFNDRVTVSTNLFVRWYANKGFFWGSIGGVIVLAGAVLFLVTYKRKRKEEK